jgi:hypothetical protein
MIVNRMPLAVRIECGSARKVATGYATGLVLPWCARGEKWLQTQVKRRASSIEARRIADNRTRGIIIATSVLSSAIALTRIAAYRVDAKVA